MLEVKEINKDVYYVTSSSHKELCNALMRCQEYYENPIFKGTCFTREDILDWNKREFKESYYKTWAGFNLPILTLNILRTKRFQPLYKEEKLLLKLLKSIKKGYIIGVSKPALKEFPTALDHEYVHALTYTNKKFNKKCLEVIKSYDFKKERKRLAKSYDKSVIEDEIIAYLTIYIIWYFTWWLCW